jgi:hypothetical protein
MPVAHKTKPRTNAIFRTTNRLQLDSRDHAGSGRPFAYDCTGDAHRQSGERETKTRSSWESEIWLVACSERSNVYASA